MRTSKSASQLARELALPCLFVLLEGAALQFVQVSSSQSEARISPNTRTAHVAKCGCLPYVIGTVIIGGVFYDKIIKPVLEHPTTDPKWPINRASLCQDNGGVWLLRVQSLLEAQAELCFPKPCTAVDSEPDLLAELFSDDAFLVHYDASASESELEGLLAVSRWVNLRGCQYPASQQDPILQPLYEPEGFNGRPALRFDGASTYMDLPLPSLGASTVCVVGSASGGVFFSAEGREPPLPGKDVEVQGGSLGATQAGAFRSGPTFTSGIALVRESLDGIRVGATQVFGGQAEAWNPLSSLNGESPPLLAQLGRRVGGPYLEGLISEVLIFDRVLSDAEVDVLEGHLRSKWGVA